MDSIIEQALGGNTVPEVELSFAGADGHAWTVVHVLHREALSDLYECAAVLCLPDPGARPDGLLAHPAKLTLARPGGDERAVHGVVRRVEDLGSSATHTYARVVLAPSLWTLSQRRDSRVFQHVPVAAIVREVLRAAGVYQGDGALVIPAQLEALPPREYCVQHRETDLDFVLRLLQEEGVPFRFEHPADGAGERLVLVEDDPTWPDLTHLPVGVSDGAMNLERRETVRWFDPRGEMRPTGMALRDYDFTRPRATRELSPSAPAQPGPRGIYEYPARLNLHSYGDGSHSYGGHDGARQARVRLEAEQVPGKVAAGSSNLTGLTAGGALTLEGHARADADARHLVLRVEHTAQAWSDLPEDLRHSEGLQAQLAQAGVAFPREGRHVTQRYSNRFECMPATAPFRPERATARPIIHGVQTARVVGPAGEEIHVDFHGRIKVQFHWDRQGQEDDRSSCWIRVAQAWAGPGWGFQFIPRVGMEVIVQFAEGDPDRPLVTGCVYNGENHHPYGLPDQKTKSAIKTNSSPTSGGYNEIRFEDKAGEEQVYVQAERDHDTLVKHDQTLTVKQHRTKTVEGNETNTIVRNRATTVHANETKEVDGNRDEEVHGPYGSSLHVDRNYKVVADETLTLESGDSRIFMKPGEIFIYSNTVRVHAPKLVEIKGGLVKINCPDSAAAPSPPQPPDPQGAMTEQGMRGAMAALGGAEGALGGALGGALQGALGQVIQSVMGGGPLGQALQAAMGGGGALAGLVQGAMGALGNAFQGLTDATPVGGAVQAMQPAAETALGRGVVAAHGLNAALADDPAWQRLSREQPEVASATLRRATSPLVRDGLADAAVPAGLGPEGARGFDGAASATLQAHRAAVDGIVRREGGGQ